MRTGIASADRSNVLVAYIRRRLVVQRGAEPGSHPDAPAATPVQLIATEQDDVSLYGSDTPWIQG